MPSLLNYYFRIWEFLLYHIGSVFVCCFFHYYFLSKRFHFKKNLRRIITELYIRDNCHPFKATLLVWVQIPMWVFVSLALRNCSVGALNSEGDLPEEMRSKQSFFIQLLFLQALRWLKSIMSWVWHTSCSKNDSTIKFLNLK